jgi:hypothetical protein
MRPAFFISYQVSVSRQGCQHRIGAGVVAGRDVELYGVVEDGGPVLVEPKHEPMRKTGIDVVGDIVAWGAYFFLFYETREDLLEGLIEFFKSGLGRADHCLWVVAEPLTIEGAKAALKAAVPDLHRHLADSRMEI